MFQFSLYSGMREHGTLAEAPQDVPDARFALPSTINWMRALSERGREDRHRFRSKETEGDDLRRLDDKGRGSAASATTAGQMRLAALCLERQSGRGGPDRRSDYLARARDAVSSQTINQVVRPSEPVNRYWRKERLLNMRTIVTSLWSAALLAPVLLGMQSASAADKMLTPSDTGLATSLHQVQAAQRDGEDIRPSGPPIKLGLNLGTLIHLPAPARTVFVANEDIADVNLKHPSFVYVAAKKPGATVLYAADSEGNVLLKKVVEVDPMPLTIIHGSKIEDNTPPPTPPAAINLVIPLQSASPVASASH